MSEGRQRGGGQGRREEAESRWCWMRERQTRQQPCTCVAFPAPRCKRATAPAFSGLSAPPPPPPPLFLTRGERSVIMSISVITALTSIKAVRVSRIVLTWHETHAGVHSLIRHIRLTQACRVCFIQHAAGRSYPLTLNLSTTTG